MKILRLEYEPCLVLATLDDVNNSLYATAT